MHPVLSKTFGGLSPQYYFRQFLFGLIFPAFMLFMAAQGHRPLMAGTIVYMVISSLLYPYSRFVYESVMGFIMGQNIFVVNAILMLFVKLVTMMICWCLAILIAPVGLAYLYYHHSRAQAQAD